MTKGKSKPPKSEAAKQIQRERERDSRTYVSRLTQANEASRATIERFGPSRAILTIQEIHDILWPRENPAAVAWTVETAERIGNVIRDAVDSVE